MGDTSISWTHRPGTRARTWNPTRGCALKSEGCRNCYAMKTARRFAGPGGVFEGLVNLKTGKWTGDTRVATHKLAEPLSWKEPSTVFVDSMSDLFYEGFTNEQIAAVYGIMAATPQHTYQVLTKRAQRRREWYAWAEEHGNGFDMMRFGPSALLTCAWEACSGDVWGDLEPPGRLESLPSPEVFGKTWPLPNVWEGVSVENQEAADERIPELLRTPAAIRFLSCEPLLGPLDLGNVAPDSVYNSDALAGMTRYPIVTQWKRIDWVIAGCESGPGARPCDVEWLRSLRDQCRASGVPFFLKQAGDWRTPITGRPVTCGRGSKAKPGGVIELPYLDGVQHAAFPEVST